MMVFMVCGLLTNPQFAYAQFPCASVSGDQLVDPFWNAVKRIKRCGLKVMLELQLLFSVGHITNMLLYSLN